MSRQLVIDACCTLNLIATGQAVEIAQALDLHLLDTPQVAVEPMFLWTPPDAEGVRDKAPFSTAPLRGAGRLETRAIEGSPLVDAFISAAGRIKDADASCIALAGVLEVPLLTDDGKERRIARALFPQLVVVSTLEIFADAAQALSWSSDQLRAVAHAIRWQGNFAPPRNDPKALWFAQLLR